MVNRVTKHTEKHTERAKPEQSGNGTKPVTAARGIKGLGERITEARLAKAWGLRREVFQSECAAALGVAKATWGRWERNAKVPELERIQQIAEELGCDVGWLINGPPKEGLYAGRMTVMEAVVSPVERQDGESVRAARGPKKRAVSGDGRGKLPPMWYGTNALTDTPTSINHMRDHARRA